MASLVVSDHFFDVADAEARLKACRGWGTNEKAIISILGHRNSAQRREIRQTYVQLHQEDHVKRLESELSENFEKVVYRWILDPADRDAVLVNVALKKPTQGHHVIIEISHILSAEELPEVRRAYQIRHKRFIGEDVASHTTGDLRKSSNKYEGEEVNARLAKAKADILRDAIKDKALNHDEVIRILTTRSKLQLTATFNRFRDYTGTFITKVLRNAINKIGTEEEITRVIVMRADMDMKEMKDAYYKRNSIPLEQALAKGNLAFLRNQDWRAPIPINGWAWPAVV